MMVPKKIRPYPNPQNLSVLPITAEDMIKLRILKGGPKPG